jgi:hypothetical protein
MKVPREREISIRYIETQNKKKTHRHIGSGMKVCKNLTKIAFLTL